MIIQESRDGNLLDLLRVRIDIRKYPFQNIIINDYVIYFLVHAEDFKPCV